MSSKTRALLIMTMGLPVLAASLPGAMQASPGAGAAASASSSEANGAYVSAAQVAFGDSVQTMNVGGLQRTYRLHLPPGYNGATPLPLVMVLHGRGGNGMGLEQNTGWGIKADTENFIAVFPNAKSEDDAWNAEVNPSRTSPNDVAFLTLLFDKLQREFRIDSRRIYCCGFSSGAFMTYRMGAALSERLAAIGVVSGTIGTRQPDGSVVTIPHPSRPLPLIAFHGKADQTVYYNGGGAIVNCLPVSASIGFWVNADACPGPPQRQVGQNGNLVREDYSRCSDRAEVVLYTFVQGTHEWPKPQNNDHFSATDAIWEFFARHPRP